MTDSCFCVDCKSRENFDKHQKFVWPKMTKMVKLVLIIIVVTIFVVLWCVGLYSMINNLNKLQGGYGQDVAANLIKNDDDPESLSTV